MSGFCSSGTTVSSDEIAATGCISMLRRNAASSIDSSVVAKSILMSFSSPLLVF